MVRRIIKHTERFKESRYKDSKKKCNNQIEVQRQVSWSFFFPYALSLSPKSSANGNVIVAYIFRGIKRVSRRLSLLFCNYGKLEEDQDERMKTKILLLFHGNDERCVSLSLIRHSQLFFKLKELSSISSSTLILVFWDKNCIFLWERAEKFNQEGLN